jgi:hypothetical protein
VESKVYISLRGGKYESENEEKKQTQDEEKTAEISFLLKDMLKRVTELIFMHLKELLSNYEPLLDLGYR